MINKLTDHEIEVIGFDADDTLWKNEDLFFEAQNEIKDILKHNSNNFDKELLKNTYWQSNTLLLHKRAHKYFPIIEAILEEYQVPDDFKYLALIESGLENVISPAGATGFWQIMKGTAKEFGMEAVSYTHLTLPTIFAV